MKKLAFLSLTFLLAISGIRIQAQEKEKTAIKEIKKEVKTEKKELKAERKALRKLEGNDVSTISKNSFIVDFGDLPNAKWKKSVYFDEVTFTKEGHTKTAYYDFYGKSVGTTEIKTLADVPVKGQDRIKTKYRGE